MRVTSRSARIISSRFAQLVALSGVIAMAACQDVTGPEEVVAATNAPSLRMTQEGVDELKGLASTLDDFTGWSLVALPDDQQKQNIVGILQGMKGHLASGKIAMCQQDVTDARSWFSALSVQQQTEVGAIGVALDLIQATIDKASQ